MILEGQPVKCGIRSALDIYLYAMRPFLVHCLRQVKGKKLEDTIRHSLNDSQVYWFDQELNKGKSAEDCIDIGHIVPLLSRNWNEVFNSAFRGDRRVYNFAANIKHCRNRLSHPTQQDIEQDVDPEFARKCFAEIADILGSIKRPEEKSWVEGIFKQLFIVPTPAVDLVQAATGPERETLEEPSPDSMEMPEAFWVYEDRPTNRTRIHRATCWFCNDGRGRQGSRLPDNRWIGPIQSIEVALVVALETERRDIAECSVCRPSE